MPSERRFRDDGTKATRFYKPEDGDDRMNENDEDVVHAGILSKSQKLKTPGIQADFGIRHRTGQVEVESTNVNFQVLRRTCATLFGAKAKDPRDTQAQLRHADPSVTLRHYQKSIPASVRAAAVALEFELIGRSSQSIRTGFEQARN